MLNSTLSHTYRKDRLGIAILCAVILLAASNTHADIVQPVVEDSIPFLTSAPSIRFGQTFTAIASVTDLESIGFYYLEQPTGLGVSFTMELFEGIGDGGTLIDSFTKTIQTGNDRWEDFDFSGNTLVEGELYTFLVTGTVNNGTGGAAAFALDNYDGGSFYDNNTAPAIDLAFRVLGSSSGVIPEPSSIASAAIGLLALSRCRRVIG